MFIDRRHTHIILIGALLMGAALTAHSDPLPVYAEASKDRMSMSVKVSRMGIIEAHRKATVKTPDGAIRHVFWFALLGEGDNTIWVAPVETLTVAAKTHSGIEDFGEPIDSSIEQTSEYEIARDVAKQVRAALIYMEQEAFDDDLRKRVEEAVEQFKRVDMAYEALAQSDVVSGSQKVPVSGEK